MTYLQSPNQLQYTADALSAGLLNPHLVDLQASLVLFLETHHGLGLFWQVTDTLIKFKHY